MLNKLILDNFTVFQHAEFNFAKGINILVGENASGKSHVLKLAYSLTKVWNPCAEHQGASIVWILGTLKSVFRTGQAFLCKHGASEFIVSLSRPLNDKDGSQQIEFCFDLNSGDYKYFRDCISPISSQLLFIPSKEVLSIFPKFISLYEKYSLSFDETYYDLCKALDNPLLRNPNQDLIDKLEPLIGGKIVQSPDGHFYLRTPTGDIGIFMVAEGLRKLGMLSYLIANDSIKENTILFFDEPETNLNPRLMKHLAEFLVELSRNNIQIIIATHNLFLMKYFDYLLERDNLSEQSAFFSLARTETGVEVERGTQLSELNTIAALEEELALYDKEQELIYR